MHSAGESGVEKQKRVQRYILYVSIGDTYTKNLLPYRYRIAKLRANR